jgi:CDP-diacylglycerol--glycerol-3-phosphate 3-phosphatidyltransferase
MAALIFVIASITDIVDGKVARKYGLVTRFGKLWDPIADKTLTGMALVGLSIIGELSWWITIVILVREWGITLLRFLILKYGVMAANRGGKLKTVTQSIAIVMYLLPLPSWLHVVGVVVMWVALILTVLTGLDYCWEAYRLRKKALAG